MIIESYLATMSAKRRNYDRTLVTMIDSKKNNL